MFPTKEDVHGIKRLAVLREAAASFNHKGYHATSLTEIAESLGVTKAALYHYFPNKNSLLRGCFAHAMDACFASLERGRKEGRNGREKLIITLRLYLHQLIDELNCCVVLMEEQALEPDDRLKLVRERDRFRAQSSRSRQGRHRGRQRRSLRSEARDLCRARRPQLGAEMVQAERRVEAGAARRGPDGDLRARIVQRSRRGACAVGRRPAHGGFGAFDRITVRTPRRAAPQEAGEGAKVTRGETKGG